MKSQGVFAYDFPAAHWRHIRSTNPIHLVRLAPARPGSRPRVSGHQFGEILWERLHSSKRIELVIQGRSIRGWRDQDSSLIPEDTRSNLVHNS